MKAILCFALLFASQLCFSQQYTPATIKLLAHDPTWLKLAHFDKSLGSLLQYESVIKSEDFFIAPDGKNNPESELLATINAINAPVTKNNEHTRCRFPARAQWLDSKLGIDSQFDAKKHCPNYSLWKAENKVGSISIVLASGYLGNPASFYGHTFIKFNTNESTSSQELIKSTLSYGAIETKNDNIAVYVTKALIGGYDAAFRKISFYNQEQTYNENENRDLWEYQLGLSQANVDFVTDHAWEILDKEYVYYFFKENCAFRMVELLEVLPEIRVTSSIDAYTIPQAVIQKLGRHTINGKPLIKNTFYYPSRQTRLYSKYEALDLSEKDIFKAMVTHGVEAAHPLYAKAEIETKQKILDTIIDYYSFITDVKEKQTQQRSPNYLKALAMRFDLPAVHDDASFTPRHSPEKGRLPSWVQISSYVDGLHGSLIRIRPAYYDQLDSSTAHVKNSALSMFDTQLVVFDNKVKLKKIDIVNIEAANPGLTGLDGDDSKAWKVKFGAEQYRSGCLDCLLLRLQGDYGYGKTLSSDLYIAAYVGGGIQNDRFNHDYIFARSSFDLIYRPIDYIGVKLNYTKQYNPHTSITNNIIKSEIRWSLFSSFDIRLSYENDSEYKDADTLDVGIGVYF